MIANGRVVAPTGVAIERQRAGGGVETRGIADERCKAVGGVAKAAYIGIESAAAGGGVGAAIFVIKHRNITEGRVVAAGGKITECRITFRGIAVAQVAVGCPTRW